MSTKQFAASMRQTIEDIRSKGADSIKCDDLIAYLKIVENDPHLEPSAVDMEQHKAKLQLWVEEGKKVHETRLELFKSVISSGQNAIKSSFLLNGGAAVAILAFIGQLSQQKPEKVSAFAFCLLPFAYGALAIAVASGCTYLTQWCFSYQMKWTQRLGFSINIVSILLALGSYGCFFSGLLDTYQAMATFKL